MLRLGDGYLNMLGRTWSYLSVLLWKEKKQPLDGAMRLFYKTVGSVTLESAVSEGPLFARSGAWESIGRDACHPRGPFFLGFCARESVLRGVPH